MAEKGKRRIQSKGEITLPKEFRDENDIFPGDYIAWKRHSRDSSKLIIEAKED
jgi:bifunctional DNA-binding transcriptional regulator/antitoxin component of YhaV-PrlF toxin-antitoxin module